jgi:hypothetical protein
LSPYREAAHPTEQVGDHLVIYFVKCSSNLETGALVVHGTEVSYSLKKVGKDPWGESGVFRQYCVGGRR